ncbi:MULTISPECIES: CsgG/HfaB family protein [Sporomusa]|uniref:CsgG/HfaB family protein n=1 Tax=Sporomusa TaxID=2375 RepID=UPI003158F3CF
MRNNIFRALTLTVSVLIAFIFSTVPQTAAAAAGGGLRYTVTVSQFENRAGWSGQWDIGDAWGMVLTDVLNQSGRFIVLGEKDMRQEALIEQDFASSGRTAQGGKTPVTGQMTPAQILIKGAITHVQDTGKSGGGISVRGISLGGSGGKAEVNITMYMVDSTTGQVLASTNVVGKSSSSGLGVGYHGPGWSGTYANFQKSNVGKAVQDAVAQGSQWMIAQLPSVPWTGTVFRVNGDNIYINRGSREGVVVGQTFAVGHSDIIRDPDTGEVLDEMVNEVARIRVVSIKEKLAVCQVISGNPGAIAVNMKIQP